MRFLPFVAEADGILSLGPCNGSCAMPNRTIRCSSTVCHFFPIITAKSNDISVSGHGGLSKNLTGEEASGFDDGAYRDFLYSWVLYS